VKLVDFSHKNVIFKKASSEPTHVSLDILYYIFMYLYILIGILCILCPIIGIFEYYKLMIIY